MLWGDTTLKATRDSYLPPHAQTTFTEIQLIQNPSTPTTHSTIVQQGGTTREPVSFTATVDTYAEYRALEADYLGGVERIFDDEMGYSKLMFINKLKPVSGSSYLYKYEYSISLLEV